MGVMDFFRGNPQPAPATAAQPQAPQGANGTVQQPADPQMQQPPVAATEVNKPDPMDTFKDLWAPAVKVEGDEEDFNPSEIFKIDPESMQAALGKINFAEGVVTQEALEAVTAGGPGAVQALMGMLNGTGAKAMQMSTMAAAKMVENAMTKASQSMDKKISSGVKLNQVSSAMQELNPALSHPAAAPMVNALKQQFTAKHPTATPTEITTMISSYLDNFAGIAAGKKEEPASTTPAGTDWAQYFSS